MGYALNLIIIEASVCINQSQASIILYGVF